MIAIFDLDGTLIDSAADIQAAGNLALAAEGLAPVTYDQVRSFIGNGAQVFVERLERASAGSIDPARTARMRRLFAEAYETAHALTTIYPGVEEALDRLARDGWRLGLCTNKPLQPTLAVLRHLGWEGRFAAVIGGDSLTVMKPDPAPLRAVIDALGPGPLVYAGDSETDAATAQAAGVPFALYTRGYRKSPVSGIPHSRSFDDWSDFPALARALAG